LEVDHDQLDIQSLKWLFPAWVVNAGVARNAKDPCHAGIGRIAGS
jgi:hypothetical protein